MVPLVGMPVTQTIEMVCQFPSRGKKNSKRCPKSGTIAVVAFSPPPRTRSDAAGLVGVNFVALQRHAVEAGMSGATEAQVHCTIPCGPNEWGLGGRVQRSGRSVLEPGVNVAECVAKGLL
jgi:hypothetical protein